MRRKFSVSGVVLTSKYLEVFGAIIAAYARAEVGIRVTISALLKEDIAVAFVLSEPYSSIPLKKVASSLAKIKLSEEYAKAFDSILDKIDAIRPIRNAIAHDIWVKGTRDNSIRPARMNINAGLAKTFGFSDKESDYTVDELDKYVKELLVLIDETKSFQEETGLAEVLNELNSHDEGQAAS